MPRSTGHGIRATFFVPGHTVESFPDETQSILHRGHELAHHSYAHVDPSHQSAAEERADMERALAAFERTGVRPLGFRSPSRASATGSHARSRSCAAASRRYDGVMTVCACIRR